MSVPTFAVVGHVSRGKSSIVSTLAADESVRIGPEGGVTRECRSFPMRVDGKVFYELIDTPGFERPRQMLQWLRQHESTTAQRRAVIEQFVREQASNERYRHECKLLKPILDGAAILYVVDGSVPFTPAYEAEMETLRWTGQPRMALINPIGDDDCIAQWRPILDQYFNLVHVFDAQATNFSDRVRLIRALREIYRPWESALDEAIGALLTERRQNMHDVALEIATMLVQMLMLVKEKHLSADADIDASQKRLAEEYRRALRRIEDRARRSVNDIYRRTQFVVRQEQLQASLDNLFSQDVWLRFGLSRGKLAVGGAAGGAMIGGTIDAMSGGASFLIGSLMGGVVGASVGYFGADKLPTVKVMNLPLGGRLLRVGPMHTPNFPWIVLDRALMHHREVAASAHARRVTIDLPAPGDQGIVAQLAEEARKPLGQCFGKARRHTDDAGREELQVELTSLIEKLLIKQEQLDILR